MKTYNKSGGKVLCILNLCMRWQWKGCWTQLGWTFGKKKNQILQELNMQPSHFTEWSVIISTKFWIKFEVTEVTQTCSEEFKPNPPHIIFHIN